MLAHIAAIHMYVRMTTGLLTFSMKIQFFKDFSSSDEQQIIFYTAFPNILVFILDAYFTLHTETKTARVKIITPPPNDNSHLCVLFA